MKIPSFITNFKMPEWFIHMVTGIDGVTVDISRMILLWVVVFFLGYSGYEVYKTGRFDHINFAIGITSIMAGGAGAVKVKESTEPRPKDEKKV